jgi:hypothetical protein
MVGEDPEGNPLAGIIAVAGSSAEPADGPSSRGVPSSRQYERLSSK